MTDDIFENREALLAAMNRGFGEGIPHNRALGMQVVDCSRGEVTTRMPYDERFVGNPETGVLHGGVITTLMDACCGASVFMKLGKPIPVATLDLRIDYLGPATPKRDVFAHAHCYKATRHVAFVRCVAYHDEPSDPIASAAGAFMIGTRRGRSVTGKEVDRAKLKGES